MSGANLPEGVKEIGEIYEKFKDNLSDIPFVENKTNYIEAGVRLTVGNYDLKNFDKVDTRFMFPILLAEAYREIEPNRYRDNDERGGFLYPKDICSRADYLEIQSKVVLTTKEEIINEIEQNLDVTKYDKIKYELDNKESDVKKVKNQEQPQVKDNEKENSDKETKTEEYDDSNELKEEHEESEKTYNDYYNDYDDSSDSVE